jgi:hypothetical protein
MKKISIVLLSAVMFTACLKDVSITNPLSENRVINLPYYLMGPIKTNFALDSITYPYRVMNGYYLGYSNGYYTELKQEESWGVSIEAVKFLPDYRSTGTIRTRFTSSKLGIDTTITLQDYGPNRYVRYNNTGYFNTGDTSKNVWGRYTIRDSPKVKVNDTVMVCATTSWIQPLQTIIVGDTIRIIFR